MAASPGGPPKEAQALSAWFGESVRAEIAELEKKGGEQHHELHAGQRVTPENSRYPPRNRCGDRVRSVQNITLATFSLARPGVDKRQYALQE